TSRPRQSATPYRRSRVSPGRGSTMALRSPIIRLNRVDFPTFGRPTIATIGLATCQLDGFWLSHPQDQRRDRAQNRSQAERGFRTDNGPQRTGDHAGPEVCDAVDAIEKTKSSAQPADIDQRADKRPFDRADD